MKYSYPPRKQIQILLIDPHEVVRSGLRMVLSLWPGFRIVGEASNANAAMQMVLDMQPTVILMELALPDVDVGPLLTELRSFSPSSKLIALTGQQSPSLAKRALSHGLDGYLLKTATSEQTICAIEQIVADAQYVDPKVARKIDWATPAPACDDQMWVDSLPELTRRELEVLQLMTMTATNKEISEKMQLGEETVRTHVKSLLRKLNQPTRTQVVVEAIKLGFIEL
ncbi:MAG: response regulator transcription factor [Caldilineaceae bacterium]|nr:response regulator transcription factor [Caldilineaceae bacterium]MCB0096265.1 response regulator transcription factor [Caldilineaceae bacterium]